MGPSDREPVLTDDDALSLWVGRVARTHAHLEYNVSNVHRFLIRLHGRGGDSKSAKGFDQLVGECRTSLRGLDADPQVLASGDVALLAAKEASASRNRVVHDMWLPDTLREDTEPPRWNTFRRLGDLQGSYASATSQDLAAVIETHTELTRTRVRVSGLFMALHAICPVDQSAIHGKPDRDDLTRYLALMTDRFTLDVDGGYDFI